MGLDIGDKTIGIAICDPLGITAQGIKTIRRKGIKSDINEIINIINEYQVETLVAGMPKNMNNTIGPSGEKVMSFCNKLSASTGMEVFLEDERLTTVAAQRMLIEADVSREKRKKVIDTVAATYILQSYLDRMNR
jgi:putative Holliday junction resolvase